MENLEREAVQHFEKLEQSLIYHEGRLADSQTPDKIKHVIQKEVDAIKFIMGYAKEALAQRGIKV